MPRTDRISTVSGVVATDAFNPRHAAWALVAALVLVAPIVYQSYPLMLADALALTALPFVGIVSLVRLMGAVLRWRWRRAASIGLALAVFVGVAGAALWFRQEVRFQTIKPFYLVQIARLPPDAPKKLSWSWSGGFSGDQSLEYDETDADKPPLGQATMARRGDANCSDITRPMGGHFYLRITDCN